jgi:hypothetical protein
MNNNPFNNTPSELFVAAAPQELQRQMALQAQQLQEGEVGEDKNQPQSQQPQFQQSQSLRNARTLSKLE